MNNDRIISNCKILLNAYHSGRLGNTKMPEDSHPEFSSDEERLVYFTLPMSLNYQRSSYALWESCLKTHNDEETKLIFDINNSAAIKEDVLRKYLLKHKIALQPNKHIKTWGTIAKTIAENFGSVKNLLKRADYDFLKLKEIVQKTHKKRFPYLSGPKIFNYWCFILRWYCNVDLKNSEFIDIAPDTHVTRCSVRLGVITSQEAEKLSKEKISERWRKILEGSGINPIDMHAPLWFWSKNGFIFKLK